MVPWRPTRALQGVGGAGARTRDQAADGGGQRGGQGAQLVIHSNTQCLQLHKVLQVTLGRSAQAWSWCLSAMLQCGRFAVP